MANYVSKLSEKEKDQLGLENPSPARMAREIKYDAWVTGNQFEAASQGNRGLSQFQSVNRNHPNFGQIQHLRLDAMNRLANPAGVPEPQLMQDYKLMEQVDREASIKAGNYWSQVAENFALGKNPSYREKSNYPTTPQAPTLPNVNMNFSGQPTPQAPQVQEQGIQAPSGSRLQQFGRGIKNFFNESGKHLDMLTETQLQQQNKALDPLGKVVDSAAGAAKDFVLDPNAPSFGESFDRRIADKVSLPEPSTIYQTPTNNVASPAGTNESLVNNVASPDGAASSPVAAELPVAQNLPSYTPYQEDAIRAQAEMGVDGLSPIPKFLSDQGIGANRAKRETAAMLQQNQALQGNGLTTVGGIPLSEFLSGKALPEQKLMRAENPMYGDNSLSRGLGGDVATQAFQDASAAREARIEQNFGNGRAVSDRERRGTGEMSMEAAVRMAGGDRVKARQMIELQRQGRDPVTGKLSDSGALTESERLARERFDYEKAQDAAKYENASAETRLKRDDEMNTEIGALGTILSQTENVAGVTKEAQGKVGINTAGFFYPLKWIGGTEAASLAGNLETIKSDAFVANITEMRNNSPTGGSVGNVSDKDLETLQSLQTSFRQNLPPKDLRKNLSEYRRIRNKVANDAKNGFIRKYGLVNFNKYFGDDAITQNAGGSNAMASGLTTPSGKKVKIY